MNKKDERFVRAMERVNIAMQNLADADGELRAARRELLEAERHSTYAKRIMSLGDLPTRDDYPR